MKNYRKLAVDLANLAYDKKCEAIIVLDLRKLTSLCDYFIIATVNSQPQMNAVRETFEAYCSEEQKSRLLNTRSLSPSWQVLDYVNIVIHLMTPPTREFYSLERLWYKAKKVKWHDKTGNKERTRRKA